MRRITFLFGSLLVAACSSDPVFVTGTDAAADVGAPAKDGGSDATASDATPPKDGATPSDSSVVDVVIPADAISLTCQSPADCGDGGASICCGSLETGSGQPPNCPIKSLTSKCASSCTTSITLTCNSTSTVRACAKNADCTEPTYGKCCTFTDGNSSVTFCSSAGLALAAGAVCK